jgi:D-tyrosyl-tRNA(Tyr) deacylase
MIALIQRVSEASVLVNKNSPDGDDSTEITGSIGAGILALVAVEKGDTEAQADRLLQRLLAYRIFEDESGRMNFNLRQVNGELMLVSQFTNQILAAQIILPVASQSMVDEVGKRMVVNVDEDGVYYYMGREYLKDHLKSLIIEYGRRKTMTYMGMEISDMKVMIRADQFTPYKYIQAIYFLLQDATIWQICFATMKQRK